jgi:hypothetical protein
VVLLGCLTMVAVAVFGAVRGKARRPAVPDGEPRTEKAAV